MKKILQVEIQKRISILEKMGMKEHRLDFCKEWNPLCSIMFSLESVCADTVAAISDVGQFRKIQMDFEKNYEAVVYYGIYTQKGGGEQLTFLYVVPSDGKKWEEERNRLRQGMPMAYVYNLSENYDDFMPIYLGVRNGVLIRK